MSPGHQVRHFSNILPNLIVASDGFPEYNRVELWRGCRYRAKWWTQWEQPDTIFVNLASLKVKRTPLVIEASCVGKRLCQATLMQQSSKGIKNALLTLVTMKGHSCWRVILLKCRYECCRCQMITALFQNPVVHYLAREQLNDNAQIDSMVFDFEIGYITGPNLSDSLGRKVLI